MVREPKELVELRRVLGAQLAVFRQAAELSQGQLARVALVDRTTVAHIEKGRSRADERFWVVVDERCRANGALLAGFRAWQAARQEHEVRIREVELAQARARAQELRAALAPPSLLGSLADEVSAVAPDVLIGQLVRLLRAWVGGMNRRELLQLWGWAAGSAALPVVLDLDPEEQERLARAIASPGRIDEQVITHFEGILQQCKHDEDTLGSRAVLNTVLTQRNLIQGFLAECPAMLRPRLLSLYSDMSSSVGYYFFDLNDFSSAWYYRQQARAAAEDAGNPELSVHVLCEMSYTASSQGDAPISIDLADAARGFTGRIKDPLMLVCVADKTARAYAVDGRYQASMVEFDKAWEGLASRSQSPVESPAYFYNEGFLASQKSDCLLRLGKPQEAVANASAGLALLDDSFVGSRAFCGLHLGNALLQCREIDEAVRVVGEAAGLAARTRSARLVRELHTTRSRMQPWQSTRAVKELDDQLVSYGLVSSSAV